MNEPRPRLVHRLTDLEGLRAAWQELSKGRLGVADHPDVGLLALVDVVIALGDQEVAVLPAKAVHRVRGTPGELGVQILEVSAEAKAGYERAMAGVGTPAEAAAQAARPIALRYPDMSAAEKMQLALRGDRDARLQVMKEGNPNLVKFLLQNPRTTAQEVATLAGNASSSLELLNLISGHPMLPQNESIRVALVKNPRAPAPLIKQHIEKLSQGQLAQLGKSPHVKDDVKRMALKLVLNRRV